MPRAMPAAGPSTSTPPDTVAPGDDYLDHLVARIAGGDRVAFQCLYAGLAMRLWAVAAARLNDPQVAAAVTETTFAEIWDRAGARDTAHGRTRDTAVGRTRDIAVGGARAWIIAIAARHIEDRMATPDPYRPWAGPAADEQRLRGDLTAVLGASPDTIRLAAATFTRIEELGRTLAAIAGTDVPASGTTRRAH